MSKNEFGSCGRASISMREKEKTVGWRDSVPTGMDVSVLQNGLGTGGKQLCL